MYSKFETKTYIKVKPVLRLKQHQDKNNIKIKTIPRLNLPTIMTTPNMSADDFITMMLIIDIFLLIFTFLYSCDIKNSRRSKTMKLVVIISNLLTTTCLVISIALLETTYKPYVQKLNTDISRTFTNCTVYGVTAFYDVPKNIIDYMVYYGSNSTVTAYTGVCNSLVQCYPSVNATIGCYKTKNSYIINPNWYSTSNINDGLTAFIVMTFLYGLACLMPALYKLDLYLNNLRAQYINSRSESQIEQNAGTTLLNAATVPGTNLGTNYSTMADLVDRTNLVDLTNLVDRTNLTDRTNLERTIEVLQHGRSPHIESSDDYE